MEDGSIDRDVLLLVLGANRVLIRERNEGERLGWLVAYGDYEEVQFFPARIHRRKVLELANRFDIPPHYFWHPEKMPDGVRPPGLTPS